MHIRLGVVQAPALELLFHSAATCLFLLVDLNLGSNSISPHPLVTLLFFTASSPLPDVYGGLNSCPLDPL